MNIKEIIQILADNGTKLYSQTCNVTKINNNKTCDVEPLNGDTEIYEVKLQANIELDNGFILYPKVGSDVLVSFINKNDAFVSLTTEIDKFEVIIGSHSFVLDDTGFNFNDGSFGGLIKISDLVNKLNNVENDINTLKGVFSGWVTAGGDGGAALKAAAAIWYGQPLINTTQIELENKNVKHG